MATTIKLKNSVTTTNAPSSLVQGEVAINITDKKVWVGNAATTPIQLLGAGASGTFGALTCTSLTNSGLTSGRVTYASTGGLLADSANFTFNGTTVTMANDASISGLTVGKGGAAPLGSTALGISALGSNSTGGQMVAVGYQAGANQTAATQGVYIGIQTGLNASGNYNTLVGAYSGIAASNTGSSNTGFGRASLNSNTSGSNNTGIGDLALSGTTTGANNTALGSSALTNNTTASNNTAVGYQSLYANTTGSPLTAIGMYALKANTTGTNSTSTGYASLFSNTTGTANSAFGDSSLYNNTTGNYNTAIGYYALLSNTTASNNTAVGYKAAYSNTTGTWQVGLGNFALYSATTGNFNIGVGGNSLYGLTTGSNNVAIGQNALRSNTTASNNTAVGYEALYSTTGGGSVAIGSLAGNSLTSGDYSVFVGQNAGQSVTTGRGNTFVGSSFANGCGSAITTGGKNTILGGYTGNQGGLDIRTASNYIVLSDGDGNIAAYKSNDGDFFIGGATTRYPGSGNTANGFMVESSQRSVFISRGEGTVLYVNRNVDDGTLVSLRQAGTEEGTISVSGSTVSYNGGHLSRWSQLPDNSKDDSILKGTVMSNLDEMCVWEKDGVIADNEQLNKMKVSDVEGDTNVAGVFVNWTMDEQYGVDDMNVAMTGDMIIRIAQGVVVQKGDLLMSAGDGTAKPQGDDIRRSKTVAKVTSNHVTCTYADGSYCVPCVLMAC